MKTKSCSHKDHKGPRELPVTRFSLHPKTSDGYQSICKACNIRLITKRKRRIAAARARERGRDPKKDYAENKQGIDFKEQIGLVDYVDEVSDSAPIGDLLDADEH